MQSIFNWSAFWEEHRKTLFATLRGRLTEKEAEICYQLAASHHWGAAAVHATSLGESYCEMAMSSLIEKGFVTQSSTQSSNSKVGSLPAYSLTSKLVDLVEGAATETPVSEPVMASA